MENRADLSQFLIHLTKDGAYDEFIFVDGPPVPGFTITRRAVVAKQSLEEILQECCIEARSPLGYFRLKINMYREKSQRVFENGGFQPEHIKVVCFSEVPFNELSSFYNAVSMKRNKYKKYGLGFWQEKIREKGCNPIFYIDSRKPNLIEALNSMLEQESSRQFSLMPFIETFGPSVIKQAKGRSDFRWEREWRKNGSLNFENEDVAFGICSESEIPCFQSIVKNDFPFIDPDWSNEKLKNHLTNFGSQKLLNSL